MSDSLDDYDDYNEYAEDNDLPPITPPKWKTWNLDFGFDFLSEEDKQAIRENWPTLQERQRDWGQYVIHLPLPERTQRITEKLAVLRGLYDDPEEWVRTALKLARDV